MKSFVLLDMQRSKCKAFMQLRESQLGVNLLEELREIPLSPP
jgi:hypothetical protein